MYNGGTYLRGGQYINFDLAWPSSSIPDDFFPSNVSLYGYSVRLSLVEPHLTSLFIRLANYQDFGVWNASYTIVNCLDEWEGGDDAAALGSVNDGSSVCCPANPTVRPSHLLYMFSAQGLLGKPERHLPLLFRPERHPVRTTRV